MSDITLREYYDSRFIELEKRLQVKSDAEKYALELAGKILDTRLERMNEVRAQLDRQANTFATKVDVDHLGEDVDEVLLWKSNHEGKASRANLIAIVSLVVSVLLAIFHILRGV